MLDEVYAFLETIEFDQVPQVFLARTDHKRNFLLTCFDSGLFQFSEQLSKFKLWSFRSSFFVKRPNIFSLNQLFEALKLVDSRQLCLQALKFVKLLQPILRIGLLLLQGLFKLFDFSPNTEKPACDNCLFGSFEHRSLLEFLV